MRGLSELSTGKSITQAGEVRSARLESLRALAAIGVMTGHIYGQAHAYNSAHTLDTFWHRTRFGGGFGVFVFFALTGYLLFWPFARQWFGGGAAIDLRRYAVNRVLRILPLYWAAVIVLLILQHSGGTFDQWWRFATFSENFAHRTVITVDGPMWSLVVEVHFYLLLPLFAWGLAGAAGGRRRRAAAILLALAAVSYWVRDNSLSPGTRDQLLELSLPSTFMFFTSGMLLALLRLEWEQRRPGWLRGPLASGDAWLAAAVLCVLLQYRDYGSFWLIALTGFFAVGACVLPLRSGRLGRVLDWRPLAVIGVASYSLYIWHNPLVIWLAGRSWLPHAYHWQLLIASGVCIAVALVSYRLIEEPFLRLRRQWSPAGATVADDGATALPAPTGTEVAA